MKYIIDEEELKKYSFDLSGLLGQENYMGCARLMRKFLESKKPVEEVASGYWSEATGMIYGIPLQYDNKPIIIYIQEQEMK